MPGPPSVRVSDMNSCPLTAGAPLPIVPPCAITVPVVKLPAARATDLIVTAVAPPPHPIAKGSMTVMICKLPAARAGTDLCAGGTPIIPTQFTVMIGG